MRAEDAVAARRAVRYSRLRKMIGARGSVAQILAVSTTTLARRETGRSSISDATMAALAALAHATLN